MITLLCADSVLLIGQIPGSRQPYAQRRAGVVKDSARGHGALAPAVFAHQPKPTGSVRGRQFRGYIHLKTIPEASAELIRSAGQYADRLRGRHRRARPDRIDTPNRSGAAPIFGSPRRKRDRRDLSSLGHLTSRERSCGRPACRPRARVDPRAVSRGERMLDSTHALRASPITGFKCAPERGALRSARATPPEPLSHRAGAYRGRGKQTPRYSSRPRTIRLVSVSTMQRNLRG